VIAEIGDHLQIVLDLGRRRVTQSADQRDALGRGRSFGDPAAFVSTDKFSEMALHSCWVLAGGRGVRGVGAAGHQRPAASGADGDA
jgi:hypothetical protein